MKKLVLATTIVAIASTSAFAGHKPHAKPTFNKDKIISVKDNYTQQKSCSTGVNSLEDVIAGAILGGIFGGLVDKPKEGAAIGGLVNGLNQKCSVKDVYQNTTVKFVIDGKVYTTHIKKR